VFNDLSAKIFKYYFAHALLAFVILTGVISFKFKDYYGSIKLFYVVLIFLFVIIIIISKDSKHKKITLREYLFLLLSVTFIIRIIFSIMIPFETSKNIVGETHNLEIRIISINNPDNSNVKYDNKFLQLFEDNTQKYNRKIKTTIIASSNFGKIVMSGYFSEINQGDIIKADINFSGLNPARNPGGFDERKYYLGMGVFVRGNFDENNFEIVGGSNRSIYNTASFLRVRIKETFNSVLPKKESGLITGIVLGDRTGISKTEKDKLYNAGLSHITALSGAAISFLVFPIKKIMKKLRISQYFRFIIIILFLIITGTIASWTPSVTRAIIMVVSIMTAGIMIRKINPFQSLIISALIILYLNPFMLFSAGFILSFCTVSGIFLFYKIIKEKIEKNFKFNDLISSALAVNISACISSFPAAMYLFDEISLSSLLSNFFVMPLFQISVILGFVIALSGIFNLPLTVISLLAVPLKGILTVIYSIASIIADFQILKFKTGFISVVFLIGIICVFYSILSGDKLVKKILLSIACICLISNSSYYLISIKNRPDVTIVFADVGQGDATFIIFKDKTSILIDSGSKRNSVKIINDMLRFYSIPYPSLYVATHMHEDHCGAMSEIISQRGGEVLFVPVYTHSDVINHDSNFKGCYYDYFRSDNFGQIDIIHGFELLKAAYNSQLEIVETGDGDFLKICDFSEITILNPPKEDYPGREKGGNDSSLVLLFEFNGFRFLIMADATKKVEDRILSSKYDIKSDVYRISHHGSPTSTNHDIINEVSAEISIISVGFNFYGHPSEAVIERLLEAGSKVYRTDKHGALIFEIRGNKMRYKTMLES